MRLDVDHRGDHGDDNAKDDHDDDDDKKLITYFKSGIGEECPKSTEYCFLETGQPDSINDEKWAELCEVIIIMVKMMTIFMMMMIKTMKSTNFFKTIISRMPGAKRVVAFARKGINA